MKQYSFLHQIHLQAMPNNFIFNHVCCVSANVCYFTKLTPQAWVFCIYEDCIRRLPWEYWIMRPRHLKVVICINHTSNLRIIRFTFTGLRSDHYLALSDPDSLHYRLRWPLGRFLSQQNVQSKDSFFSKKRYICQNKVIFEKVMTQIFDPKICSKHL